MFAALPIKDKDRMDNKAREILQFWFGDVVQNPERLKERNKFWYESSMEIDAAIRDRFQADVDAAAGGEYDAWCSNARSALALVILFDQFPRNIYRGTAQAFAHDSRALACSEKIIANNKLAQLEPIERTFALMPLQHSEELQVQKRSVKLFDELATGAPTEFKDILENNLQYAKDHLEIIEKFGRFPHRNAVLGRESTDEELVYLSSGGQTFGQG